MSPGGWAPSPPHLFILIWINVTDYLTDHSLWGIFSFFFLRHSTLSFCCLGDSKSIASCGTVLSIPNERGSVPAGVIGAGGWGRGGGGEGGGGGGPRVTWAVIGYRPVMSRHWGFVFLFFLPPLLVRGGGVSAAERSARLSDKKPHQAPWWCSDGTKFPKRAAHRRASQLVPLSVRLNAPLPPPPPPPPQHHHLQRKIYIYI